MDKQIKIPCTAYEFGLKDDWRSFWDDYLAPLRVYDDLFRYIRWIEW